MALSIVRVIGTVQCRRPFQCYRRWEFYSSKPSSKSPAESTEDKQRKPPLPEEKDYRSPPIPPPLYMDTYKLVQDLTRAGYSQSQAEASINLLTSSLQSSMSTLTVDCVKRHEMDILSLRLKGDVDSIRGNMVLMEKTVIESLRKENEVLRGQIDRLVTGFKEEVDKVQSGLRLDLNLEKSRIKEEATGLQQLIKDTNNTIEKEVAQLRTQIESQKLESIKYLAGGIISMVTIMMSVVLGLWRLLGK